MKTWTTFSGTEMKNMKPERRNSARDTRSRIDCHELSSSSITSMPNQYHTRAVIITWLALVLFVLGSFELVDGIVISVATTFVTFHLFGATFVTLDSSIPQYPFELANAIAAGEAGAAAKDHGGPEA